MGMQHLFGLEWPRRGGGGVLHVGGEDSTDRLPSPFLRDAREERPGGRLIRDVEGVSFLEKWTFGERKLAVQREEN